jgi:hypothetical protein
MRATVGDYWQLDWTGHPLNQMVPIDPGLVIVLVD